jgi:hypothetical protein
METNSTDANTEGTPSTPSDANVQASSPAETTETQETVDGQTPETVSPEAPVTEGTGEETSAEQTESEDTTETTVEGEETPTEVVEEVPPVLDKPEDDKLPFNSHPRWKELISEKNQYKQAIEESKPLVEQAKVTNEFLRDNQITAQEYQSALQYLLMLRKDPTQAYAMLKPTFEQLALLTGDRLPEDLQTEVASGMLSAERASEIARSRGQQNYAKWRGQQQQQQSIQQSQDVVQGTIQSWSATKQSSDPDFKPGTPLWEQVDLRIRAMPVFKNGIEAQQGSEKAYAEAKALLAKFQVRATPAAAKRLPVTRSTIANNHVVMKTAADVMNAIKQGVKPHQMRYS